MGKNLIPPFLHLVDNAMLKSEKREKIKRNRGKMSMSGQGLFNLLRIIQNKCKKIDQKQQ